ncbi:MAG: glycosyltransferase [Thermoanaerobaculales bacterium]|jgi:ceramide glucosyltransferase|nr:glycosyltransferase [Thermoanaerobaculales bacterium]
MVTTLLVLMIVAGWGLVLTMHLSQRRQLRSPAAVAAEYPPVSILKPLKGVDADLETNLESFFDLDYPDYEIVFGVQDPSDLALDVARRVAARHPGIATRFVIGGPDIGLNRKVNNLANMLPRARHEHLLISDSNVMVMPDMLSDMMGHLGRDVGLVTSFIRGTGGEGLGGALESLQLNTFVMGGVAAVSSFGRVCAVGKSMLMRNRDLERIGGFGRLADFLAEDQVCGEEIDALGLEVAVCPRPVDNVLGKLSVRGFAGRHLRWARIRRRIHPLAYLGETLTNPVPPAVALLLVDPGVYSAAIAALTIAILSTVAFESERALGVRRRALVYPPLEVLRGLTVGALWPVPFISSSVAWRGTRYRVGRRTLLVPSGRTETGAEGS